MGLEKYKQVLFEGTSQTYPIWFREDVAGSGLARPITGLNEFAPELNLLSDEDKKAKIAQIRETVATLEGTLASNKLEVKDPKFWEKVKVLKPDNAAFWKTISITVSNNDVFLEKADTTDQIRIFAIEAGGFPEIAPSFEAAKNGQKKYKFYLDKFEDTVKETTKTTISEARAKAVLITLYDENINKLRLVCKAIDTDSVQYKKTTPNEVLFANMETYINGFSSGVTRKNTGSAENFLKIAKLEMDSLILRALVKDCIFHGFLTARAGMIFETGSDSELGYSIVEVAEYLKNPLHDATYTRLLKKVEKFWNE